MARPRPTRPPLLRLLLVAAAGLPATAAHAQTVADDARCLFLSNAYASRATDPARRQIATSAGAYFLGRLDGRASPAAIRTAFAESGKLKTAEASSLMNACVRRAERADMRMREVLGPATQGR